MRVFLVVILNSHDDQPVAKGTIVIQEVVHDNTLLRGEIAVQVV